MHPHSIIRYLPINKIKYTWFKTGHYSVNIYLKINSSNKFILDEIKDMILTENKFHKILYNNNIIDYRIYNISTEINSTELNELKKYYNTSVKFFDKNTLIYIFCIGNTSMYLYFITSTLPLYKSFFTKIISHLFE